MTRSISIRRIMVATLAVLGAACGGPDKTPKIPLALSANGGEAKAVEDAHSLLGPDAKAALDSGNALYRRKEFVKALAAYRLAADRAPQHTAPLFGIYMVAREQNNVALADSAMAGIRARNALLPQGKSAAPHSMSDSALKELRARMKKDGKSG